MRVELIYFKSNGTYYSNGSYETDEIDLESIWSECIQKNKHGRLPGLTKGHSEFIVFISVPNFSNNVSKLIGLGSLNNVNIGGNMSGQIISGNYNIVT